MTTLDALGTTIPKLTHRAMESKVLRRSFKAFNDQVSIAYGVDGSCGNMTYTVLNG